MPTNTSNNGNTGMRAHRTYAWPLCRISLFMFSFRRFAISFIEAGGMLPFLPPPPSAAEVKRQQQQQQQQQRF
ncbi:hypothetical protein BC938DRAFT_472761 [Jimgerdemannia flammicorona]|uniref:Uncharacterized protein n=1 Tax=Jimgerdemannia flammicorona TaxID=994334 RepID=A0A433Q5F2_9FUNG|nr:hypothetical protein BC938DRAFT_472761 [Jimgerdemannia flammicorona]